MKLNTTTTIQVVMMILVLLIPALSIAQPPPFGGGDDVMDVPVDGGLSLLAAAGIGYGAKKLRKRKQAK